MNDQRQSQQPADQQTDPFYVGYLPAPEQHRKAMRLLIALMVMWVGATAVILVLTQRTPGRSVWDNSNERSWTGVFVDDPYPMLVSDDPKDPHPMLVVSMGKRGAHDRLREADGHRITVRGYQLNREGRHLIELSDGPDAIEILERANPAACPAVLKHEQEPVELVGEIIDGKCYLGAMKPGDGLGHRACALLCIRGGLPPMFVAESEVGEILYPLLIVDGSTHLEEPNLSKVACRVRVRGQIGHIDGMPVISTTSDQIMLADTFSMHKADPLGKP